MSEDQSQEHQGQAYDEDDQDVVYDNEEEQGQEFEQEQDQQGGSSPSNENHNMRYQQHDQEDDNEQQEGELIQENQDAEDEEEERVVRAQNHPQSQNQEQLQRQQSNEMNSKQKRNEFLRQENRSLDDEEEQQHEQQQVQQQQKQQSQNQNQGQLDRKESYHQQQLEQEQLILQQQQQQHQSRQLQSQKSQQEQILFSQFLNEILDSYRTTARAFKSIDRHNKGFIELNDLGIELAARFGIENEAQHKEIFVKLGHGNARINRDIFDAAFEDIVQERYRQQQEALACMNVVTQNYDSGHSPFKDKSEREEIINILKNPQTVNLEEANKVEHFTDDSQYAPVIRRLRQQPNFNEFVRSYNTLQFPKYQSQNSSQQGFKNYQPFTQIHSLQPTQPAQLKQQSLLRHELFSNPQSRNYRGAQQLLDEYRSSALPLPNNQHYTTASPPRQLKISTNTFSPNRFYQSLDSPKDFLFERKVQANFSRAAQANNQQQNQPKGVRFLSPQYSRRPNQTFLGFEFGPQNYQSQVFGNQLRKSSGNFNSSNNFNSTYKKPSYNNMNNSRLFASQEISKEQDFLHKSYVMSPTQSFGKGNNPLFQSCLQSNFNSNLFSTQQYSSPLASPNMVQSSFIGQKVDLRNTKSSSHLNKLKKKLNSDLEALSQIHRTKYEGNTTSNLNQSLLNPNNISSRNIKEQFNQYLSQIGGASKNIQSSPPRVSGLQRGQYQVAYPLEDETDRFGDILSRLSGTGTGRSSNLGVERRRPNNRQVNFDVFGASNSSPFRNNSLNKRSQSPNFNLSPSGPKGGVHGNLQRVKQIQASLRAIPNKQKVKIARNNSKNKSGNYYDKKSGIYN